MVEPSGFMVRKKSLKTSSTRTRRTLSRTSVTQPAKKTSLSLHLRDPTDHGERARERGRRGAGGRAAAHDARVPRAQRWLDHDIFGNQAL